ncbi:hypothetical protein, partial [Frankia sp. CiP1_Cm_nod2]|uniref:hypothetical protein n=1 Tax=Frankia sp. CiP1_Cm_nod2 TaxID=2897161 RepID=UPI0020240BFC
AVFALCRPAAGCVSGPAARGERNWSGSRRVTAGNSSLPPSTDGAIPGRPGPTPRTRAAGKSGRKRGKQPGADGISLAWNDDAVRVACRPAGRLVRLRG